MYVYFLLELIWNVDASRRTSPGTYEYLRMREELDMKLMMPY